MLWHSIAIVLMLVVNTSCENGIVVLYEMFVTFVCYCAMLSFEIMIEIRQHCHTHQLCNYSQMSIT